MKFFKKSQITLFIIIAIVVVVLFSVMMIVFTRLGSQQIRTARTVVTEVDASFNHFNSYIDSCLSSALDDGLYILGRQGGFFYENQPGSTVDFQIYSAPSTTCFNSGDFNITYINDHRIDSNIITGSGYPCIRDDALGWPSSLNYLQYPNCTRIFSHNMRGIDLLPFGRYQEIRNHSIRNLKVPLCSEEQNLDLSNSSHQLIQQICVPSPFEDRNKYSIQNQLENYIEFRLEQCYDEVLEYITDEIDAEVSYKGDFNVSIFYGEKYTAATLNFPLVLNFSRIDATSKSFDYYAQSPVRLKNIYALLYGDNIHVGSIDRLSYSLIRNGIIDHDVFNLTYDIELDSFDFLNRFRMFNLSIERCYDEYGSVVRILDEESIIYGRPYEYLIRMWNRRPALNTIKITPTNLYDIYTYEGSSLIIFPLAFDLDDEGKAGYELKYDYIIPESDEWYWRKDYFYNNSLYLYGEYDELKCIHPKYGITKNRCTIIELNESDIGSHNLRVKVTDFGGEEDWQDLKIFVDQKPNLTYVIENIYNIPPVFSFGGSKRYITSLEDPFIINTSESTFSLGLAFTNYLTWQDKYYDPPIIDNDINFPSSWEFNDLRNNFINSYNLYPGRFRIDDNVIIYPSYSNYSLYSFWSEFVNKSNEVNNRFNFANNYEVIGYLNDFQDYFDIYNLNYKLGYPFKRSQDALTTINLTYFRHGSAVESRDVDIFVAECIPYRSNTPSYPYNLLRILDEDRNINPYYGNHTCCSAGYDDINHYDEVGFDPNQWSYKPEGTECYNLFEIGTYADFMLTDLSNISSDIFKKLNDSFDVFKPETGVISPNLEDFDRYVRELRGVCSGDRGNICIPETFSILRIPYCGDKKPDSYNSYSSYFTEFGSFFLNWKVRDTMSDFIEPYYGNVFYTGDLCVCGNKTTGQPIIINTSNSWDNPDKDLLDLYCCFEDESRPPVLKDKPCVLEDCAIFDVTESWTNNRITDTIFTPGSKSPRPYCQCGDYVVNVDESWGKFCCNQNGIVWEVTDSCTNLEIIHQ
jgi:hypothetical protein